MNLDAAIQSLGLDAAPRFWSLSQEAREARSRFL